MMVSTCPFHKCLEKAVNCCSLCGDYVCENHTVKTSKNNFGCKSGVTFICASCENTFKFKIFDKSFARKNLKK